MSQKIGVFLFLGESAFLFPVWIDLLCECTEARADKYASLIPISGFSLEDFSFTDRIR